MGLFRKVVGFLGFGSHNETHDDDHYNNTNNNSDDIRPSRMNVDPIPTGPRRGFSVPVQVPVDRNVAGPILVPSNGDGGVQGLRWYAARLKIDEDGDVADEFLCEVSPEMSSIPHDNAKPLPRFQVNSNTRQAKIKNQILTPDGTLQHCVDYQGQSRWV